MNARSVHGEGNQLFVDDLLEEWPADRAALDALRERVLATPSYRHALIAQEGRVTAISIKSFAYSDERLDADEDPALSGFEEAGLAHADRRVLSARENGEFCRAVLAAVERNRRDDVTMHMTGQPLVAYALMRSMATDVPIIFGGALAIVGLLILVLFRRISPILLAASVVVLSLVSTLGIAQLLGFPISLPTQILPSFLLAVGVGYVVHLLTIFFRVLGSAGSREAALERALRHVGLPILMTAVTTIAGLVSFVAASMEQAFQLGITGAVGGSRSRSSSRWSSCRRSSSSPRSGRSPCGRTSRPRTSCSGPARGSRSATPGSSWRRPASWRSPRSPCCRGSTTPRTR